MNIRYRVRTVEYFKFPNLEGAMIWEKLINKGGEKKMRKNLFFNLKNSNINDKNYKINI